MGGGAEGICREAGTWVWDKQEPDEVGLDGLELGSLWCQLATLTYWVV